MVPQSSSALTTPTAPGILNARPDRTRSPRELLGEKIKDHLINCASALARIDDPILKARMSVLMLDYLSSLLDNVKIGALPKLWTPDLQQVCASAIAIFRAAYSLHSEVLQGFREHDPEFVCSYHLQRGLFHGRIPVPASDLKDTLTTFTQDDAVSPSFPGVREAIDRALRLGKFYIVTGDTHVTTSDQFLVPNRWASNQEGKYAPTSLAARNLVWLPRTGMDIVEYHHESGTFIPLPLVKGIRKAEIPLLRQLLNETAKELCIVEYFSREGRQYAHKQNCGPCHVDVRPGGSEDEYSVSFFPAGILEKSARSVFKADPSNAPLLEAIVCRLNQRLNDLGLSHIIAKRGGLSTVDLVTSDKGVALARLQKERLESGEYFVFTGDRIALNGNDVEAIHVADVSIQVGNEWDPTLYPTGARTLLRSKRLAAEGGAAEYINRTCSARRLALTGIFSPRNGSAHHGTNRTHPFCHAQFSIPGSPKSVSLRSLLATLRSARGILLQEAATTASDRKAAARILTQTLKKIPVGEPELKRNPLGEFEIQLLRRITEGESPILASDLKDTLAVFDSSGVQWFPGVRSSFLRALQNGPFFLMTGDSLPNITDKFLFPAGLITRDKGQIASSHAGINQLHLVTRTGLDRVVFDLPAGMLKRLPLVPGIPTRDIPAIKQILARATEIYRCGTIFSQFAHEERCPPGFVDIRGLEFGAHDASFAYFPAGVLMREERPRFRETMTSSRIFRTLAAYIRGGLHDIGQDSVLVQQGGISTLDLTTATKGTALAQLRREMLHPHEFLVYLGDTITHVGNDGSTVGVAEFTVQVGKERDDSISTPPGYYHLHSPNTAREGGTAQALQIVLRMQKLARLGIWR